jgi:phosphodiesterase/alkaline phosphatase D-like protein
MKPPISRLALALLLALLATPAMAQITHGPIVGGVTHAQARFVVRTATSQMVALELSTDPADFSAPILTTTVTTDAVHDYFGQVAAAGLAAATVYYYRPVLDGVAQPAAGQFRTFPMPGTTSGTYTFGFGSCQQAVNDPTSWDGAIWPRVDTANVEFFLQTGDWGYPDYAWEVPHGYPPYFHQIPGQLEASYEVKYDPSYPMHAIFGTVPLDYVYDDHDFTHNNSDGSYPDKQRSVDAYRAYFPGYDQPAPDAIYHSFRYGNAEFFVLDNRTLRDPNGAAFPNIQDWLADPATRLYYAPGPDHRILGADQLAWLTNGLVNSTATWKFIVSTMPWNPGHRAGVELACALQGVPGYDPISTPGGVYTAAEIAIEFSDGGAGFPADWIDLIDAIAGNHVENVILLSGDSHTACIDDGANSLLPEWMAGGLDRANGMIVALQEQFGIFTWHGQGQHYGQPNFDDHYGKVTVNGDESVTVEIIDTTGQVIATDTVQAGFVPSPVGITVAPRGQLFGQADLGTLNVRPLFVINSGADDLTVGALVGLASPFQVVGLTPDFQIDPAFTVPFTVHPGEKRLLGAVFAPLFNGTFSDTLAVISNDPEGPVGVVFAGAGSSVSIEDPWSPPPADRAIAGPSLSQNQPNPFNPMTSISFRLPAPGRVTLSVFDLRGRRVATVVAGELAAGDHVVSFDGASLTSGTYVYRLEGDDFLLTRKMQLVK